MKLLVLVLVSVCALSAYAEDGCPVNETKLMLGEMDCDKKITTIKEVKKDCWCELFLARNKEGKCVDKAGCGIKDEETTTSTTEKTTTKEPTTPCPTQKQYCRYGEELQQVQCQKSYYRTYYGGGHPTYSYGPCYVCKKVKVPYPPKH